jgi:hypothetical protein
MFLMYIAYIPGQRFLRECKGNYWKLPSYARSAQLSVGREVVSLIPKRWHYCGMNFVSTYIYCSYGDISFVWAQTLQMGGQMKKTVFWDVAPCSLSEIDRRFEGAYCTDNGCSKLPRSHGATSKKTDIFILIAVRTWNLTNKGDIVNFFRLHWKVMTNTVGLYVLLN